MVAFRDPILDARTNVVSDDQVVSDAYLDDLTGKYVQAAPNPPDGGVQVLTALTKWPFGRAKILWDCILLVITRVVSLAFTTDHSIVGIGVGTVLAFFAIGNIISWVNEQFGAAFKAVYDKDVVVAKKAEAK